MLTRRGFLGRLAGALAAALASTELAQLSFPPAPVAVDSVSGISMRFIRSFDHSADALRYSRLDVFYGLASPSQFGCRIENRGSFATYLAEDRVIQERVAFPHCCTCIRMIGPSCRAQGKCLAQHYVDVMSKPDLFGRVWEA